MTEKTISDEELDKRHREMSDKFIDLANQFSETNGPENVGMALLFATSRYNAFVVTQHAETIEVFEKDLDKAKSFFSAQYLEMLDENLEDYKKVYEKYYELTN